MKSEKKVKLGKALIFAVIFVMLALISVGIGIASATTIYVPDDYAKIQWTVDNASAVDTINVMGGTNENEENASLHLYEQMDKYKSGTKLRLIESYVGTVTHPTTYTAWVYDNDLAILALADRGTAEDKERAEILCDALVWCQNHDQDFSDGRVRDGYWATDIKDLSGKNSAIKSPGSGTGNMAWTIIALLHYYEVSNDTTYLNASKRLGNWIFKECYNDNGAGGYTGGYEDKNFDWELEKITWKSTEHNIDAYVAFLKLYNVTGNTTWLDRAIHANKFVKAMWNEREGHFWTGTLNDGVTLNEGLLPEDVNTWGLMALGNPNKYGGGIRWVEKNCKVDSRDCGCNGRRFKGFDCDDDKDGIWFEGTAHMCIAYQIMNETDNSSKYISELRSAQTCANNSNGKGIVATCHDGVTCCHWEFPNALHIGATSWYMFAERKLNPFWGINTSDRILIMWYVDDDGGADFTSIQDAVDTANDGDIIIVNSGKYTENVNVTKQLILMGVDTGSGKSIVDAGGNGSAIMLSADGITLDGFTVTNSGSSREDADAGIRVTSNNNIITGNNVSNNNGSGIYLNSSCGNNITGNTFVNDGLFVTNNSYQNTVENNIVNGKPLIYLEQASDFEVTAAGQVILVNCTNITVGNLDLSNTCVGVELLGTEDSIISNNTLSNNRVGICLGYSCNNNNITGNTASNNLIHGIVLENSSNSNNIIGNSANNNYGGGIVIMDSCNNNNITGNTASYNWAGIVLLYSCNNNNIIGNNASYNNCGGIVLGYSCNNNNIIGNNASYNNCKGIEFTDSNNNNITGNNVGYNNYGIYLQSSSNNKIYLNNFINNTNNAYSFDPFPVFNLPTNIWNSTEQITSSSSTNIWNSAEQITYTHDGNTYTNYVGNYWSDYKAKYPYAEEIDGCGILDTPYSIDSDNDNYPLMKPCENYLAHAPFIFDTGQGTYPSIMGTHTGTIKPSSNINVSKLYTYPCAGTGGHTESIELEENGTLIANGTWDGYLDEDWHNITLHNVTDGTHYVTLLQDHEYYYTIRTGSYPQILHAASKEVTGGTITCTSFVDANGKTYTDWIPAIKFF